MRRNYGPTASFVPISLDMVTKPDTQDLPPTKEHGTVGRDYKYKRLSTVSLLTGLDLLTGNVIPHVSDSHKSSDFTDWLKKVDKMYPEHDTM